MNDKQKKIITVAAIIAAGFLIFLLVKDLFPLLKQVIADSDDETQMIQYIKAYGIRGVPILIGLQFLQVMIPFFPASPVQILGGLCYGIWLGSLLCLIGFTLGHSFLFIAVRKLGDTLQSLMPPKSEAKQNSLFNRFLVRATMKTENLVFILYLIPMFPNGMLPFVFARTKIGYRRYLLYMVAAMIPSTVICTAVGDRLASGDLLAAVIIAGIFIIIMVLTSIFKNKILMLIDKNKDQKQ